MPLYVPPEAVSTAIWTSLPDEFRKACGSNQWVAANKPGCILRVTTPTPGQTMYSHQHG